MLLSAGGDGNGGAERGCFWIRSNRVWDQSPMARIRCPD
jgi:hypothetical protein